MLSIVGIGSAYPDTVIHNEDLLELRKGNDLVQSFPSVIIKARRTSMPLSYFKDQENIDAAMIPEIAITSPSKLGVSAAQDALKSAGIEGEQLGFIIGDCSTPYETIPAEGQRITGGLGLKVASYDIIAASCALSAHCSAISKWKEERIPDYILSVSTNTPTQTIDYSKGEEAFYFGDAASAVVLSSRIPGKLKIKAASYTTYPCLPDFLVIDLYAYLKIGSRPSQDLIESWVSGMLSELDGSALIRDETKMILPPLFEESIASMLCKQGFQAKNIWSNAEFLGDSLGSYSAAVLAEHWGEINSHSQVLIVQIGAGVGFAYLFLGV